MDLSIVHAHIPAMREVTAVQQIHRGFSSDGKYLLYEGGDRPSCVLRTAALDASRRAGTGWGGRS
jgi:hypothetical protein